MGKKPLRDVDAGERAERLRVFVWLGCSAWLLLLLAEFKVFGSSAMFYLLAVLDIPFLAIVGGAMIGGVSGQPKWSRPLSRSR